MSTFCAHGFSRPVEREALAGEGAGQLALFIRDDVALLTTRFDEEPDPWESLVVHDKVLGRALVLGPVVPLKAGYVFESEADAGQLLEAEHARAARLLARFEGRMEANVRFLYEEDVVVRELVAANPQLRRMGQGYAEQVLAGQRIAAQLERKRLRESAALLQALKPHAEATAVHETGELMVLNASFLLRHEQVPEFEKVLERLLAENAGRMTLKFTAPLPFYSFLDG